jgi:hypothetical protein
MILPLDIIKKILKYNNINKVPIYIISKKFNSYYSNKIINKFLKIKSIKNFSNEWQLFYKNEKNCGPIGDINGKKMNKTTYSKILKI